jgi:hypothetical protein
LAASADISVDFKEFEYLVWIWCAILGYQKTSVALPTESISNQDFLVCISLHYETLGLNLKGNIVKKHTEGDKLISECWEWIRLSVSPEVFAKCVKLNYIPFSMEHQTDTAKIPKELLTVFDAILAGRFQKLGITHSFACGQAYGATMKINSVQHSKLNPWHPTNFITELKRILSSKNQNGQKWCPSQVWDYWSSEIRTLFGFSEKCTLAMESLMGIQNSEGYTETQRNIAEGCSRGGKITGLRKRTDKSGVPGKCSGCGALAPTKIGKNGKWSAHVIRCPADTKRFVSCLGEGHHRHCYLPI